MKPHIIVMSGYGLNSEEETKFAFELADANADIVHINDVIANKKMLKKYQVMVFPGGFAYGDDTGSGNAYANKVRNHLWDEVQTFLSKDKVMLGICNGFQILVNLGVLPAFAKKYGEREVALLPNASARYSVRYVDLKPQNNSFWFKNIDSLSIPISHGEGRFFATAEVLNRIKAKGMVAATYEKGEACTLLHLEANPNGSIEDIAAITDESGKVMGMMPHPERALFFTSLPYWTLLKEQYMMNGQKIPKYGAGLQVFKNVVTYFV